MQKCALKTDQVPRYQDPDVPTITHTQIEPPIKPKDFEHSNSTQLRKRVDFCHRQNHRPHHKHTRPSIKNNSGA